MATAVRASASNSASSGTAMTVSEPAGTTTGDVVIISVHGNGNTTIADNNGATPFTEDLTDYSPNPSSRHTVAIFSRRIEAGDPSTFAFTLGSSNRWSVVAVTISDPHATDIYDVAPSTGNAASADNSDSGDITAPTITTNFNGAIHIVCGYWDTSAAGTITEPSGYTNLQEVFNQPQGLSYKAITSAGPTGAQDYSDTDTGARIGLSFAIKEVDAVVPTYGVAASASDGEEPSSGTIDVSLTIPTGYTDLVLVVATQIRDVTDADRNITGITWNGSEALSQMKEQNNDTYDLTTEQWALVNPTTGAHTIAVTTAGVCSVVRVTGICLYGIAQSGLPDASSGTSAATGHPSLGITTSANDCIVIDSLYTKDAVAPTVGADQSVIDSTTVNGVGDGAGVSYERAVTAGAVTMSWTQTATNEQWVTCAVSYPKASAGGTNMQINIGDSWKTVGAAKINIGDSWKEVVAIKQNIGDTWKDVF